MDAPEKTQQATESQQETLVETDMSVEDALSAEFDRMEAAEAGETDEQETSVSEEEHAETTAEVVEAAAEATEEVAAAEEEQQSAEESGYTEPAPERWPDEMREVYDKLPPEARQMMMEQVYKPMQRTYTETTTELANMKKSVEPMIESMNQYRNDFERMGINPADAFRTQMAWAAHFARVGPQQGVADMQAAYGQTPAQGGQQEEVYLTPVERAMREEINGLKQQMGETSNTVKTAREQFNNQQQAAYANGVRNELQSFISEQKDGKPAHPHVEKVAPAIAGIIRGGLIDKADQYGNPVPIRDQMAKAYDMACRLDPSISTAPSSQRQVTSAVAAQEVDVVANTPAGQADVPTLTLAEQIEADYDKLARRTG